MKLKPTKLTRTIRSRLLAGVFLLFLGVLSGAFGAVSAGATEQTTSADKSLITQCDSLKGKTNGTSNRTLCRRAFHRCDRYSGLQKSACQIQTINTFKKNQQPAAKPGGKSPQSPAGSPSIPSDCSYKGGCDLIAKYINPLIDTLSIIFGLVATASLILGAINYITSEGDPQKAAKAKSRMVNTVFAILAYAVLYGFLQFLVPGGVFNRNL